MQVLEGLDLSGADTLSLWTCQAVELRSFTAPRAQEPPASSIYAANTRGAPGALDGRAEPSESCVPHTRAHPPRHVFSGMGVESLRFKVWAAFMAVVVCFRETPCSSSRRNACQVLCAVGPLRGGPLCIWGVENVDGGCAGRVHTQIGTVGVQVVPGQVMVPPPEAR